MPNFNPDNYIDVQERINRFWSEYPGGAIRTDLQSDPADFNQCRYRARIWKTTDDIYRDPDATGWAFEVAGGGGANRTSHEENCETSAIGRALANMGYATSRQDRPSRQEMAKVNPRPIKSDAAAEYQNAEQFSEARHAVNASTTQSPSTHKPPNSVNQQSTLTDVEPGITSWKSLWTAIRAAPYYLMSAEDFTELVQRKPDQFKSPQHAFNAVKKARRERDAAIDAARSSEDAAK